MTVMVAGVTVLFLTMDADGKIEWGDPLLRQASENAGGQRKAPQKPGEEGAPAESKNQGEGDSPEENGAMQQAADGAQDEGEGDDESKNKEVKNEEHDIPIVTFQDCDLCPLMVVVNRGTFFIGSSKKERGHIRNEGPQTRIFIRERYAVSQTEITRRQFIAFVKETGHFPLNSCIVNGLMDASANYLTPGFVQDYNDPIVCISWYDARAYTKWLSKKTGGKYRLITEAEWEFMARAGTTTPYWSEKGVSRNDANFGNDWHATRPVGTYNPNKYGIKDTSGNVTEWVEDCWHSSHKKRSSKSTAWKEDGNGDCSAHVVRGGAWDSHVTDLRSAARTYEGAKSIRNTIGLRVAKSM